LFKEKLFEETKNPAQDNPSLKEIYSIDIPFFGL